jgi:hypothetical protein
VVVHSNNDISRAILRGEIYSHSFNLVAPNSPEKKYLVFLTFHAFFSPEGIGAKPQFLFNASDDYNVGKGQPGYIGANELPPITVDKQNQASKGRLIVEIENPYGTINPRGVDVTIDNVIHTTTNGSVSVLLDSGIYHSVEVPHTIDITKHKIHAKFLQWSDGWSDRYIHTQPTYDRQVFMNSDNYTSLYAVYETQYRLLVNCNSWLPTETSGAAWYNAGAEARFTVNPWPMFLILYSFDRWEGDNNTLLNTDYTLPSGSLTMDGPKEIGNT